MDVSDFDGQHGISAYNKTYQEKFEDAYSTFISPKFVQLMSRKPLSEWIISVGRQEGFISSRQWIDTQNMLDDIAEKYNRPHRKTNALLAGLLVTLIQTFVEWIYITDENDERHCHIRFTCV